MAIATASSSVAERRGSAHQRRLRMLVVGEEEERKKAQLRMRISRLLRARSANTALLRVFFLSQVEGRPWQRWRVCQRCRL